jgi:CRISPR/Cas system CSM-associated protein Csm2 small subunit
MESSSQLQNKVDDIKKRIDVLNRQLGRTSDVKKTEKKITQSVGVGETQQSKKVGQKNSDENLRKQKEMNELKAKLLGVKK